MKTKEKAGTVATVPSLCNQSIAGGNQEAFAFDYAEKQQDLQVKLLAFMEPKQKVIRLYRCFGCEKSFALRKMSSCLILCRNCHATAQGKGKIAKNNFTEKTLNRFHGFLRRQLV